MRVLSLDGGGIRGLYQIEVLKVLEKEVGNLNDYFDLIIGTSVGAMLGAYIRMGLKMDDVENNYLKNLNETFKIQKDEKGIEIQETIRLFKFNDATLKKYRENIKKEFLDKKITKTLLTVSINISDRKLKIFKLDGNSEIKDYVDGIMSTTALPGLFKPHEIDGKFYSDGGVLYNDPSLLALSEALKIEKDISKIKIISIGTLDEVVNSEDIYKETKEKISDYVSKESKFLKYLTTKSNSIEFINFVSVGSPASYSYNYATSFFNATNNGHLDILNTIYSLTNSNDNYLRINHIVENKTNALKYLFEFSEIVKKDENLVGKIKKWI
ncbi:patatin-like phospholipase family protein [Oceanivirga miroungae]|uniref:PNPLA domain-containing protein n=1 Tax=Oceanivirga miroungae TaxID=1130046 RepID=A0A6I8MBK6_9FUSO|nr:patatin-like phospholipase family protein [Oceanivirga miroungae]VWL85581.1 hypothetical protein OMES3154_00867 [Oceanivirga miroungae]